jgi:hypothetical protein
MFDSKYCIGLCGLLAVLISVNSTGQPADTVFQLTSGVSIRITVEELPGEPSRVIFGIGEQSQVVSIGVPQTVQGHPLEADGFPLRVRAIFLPSMKEPLVLAYSSGAGASDCSYSVTPIGIQDGSIPRFVVSGRVTFSNEGGLAIWASGRKTRMVVWSPIWAGREGHYDAHRYVYFWYLWNPSRHKFHFIRSTKSARRLDDAKESLDLATRSSIEISSRTRTEWFPEAADGC